MKAATSRWRRIGVWAMLGVLACVVVVWCTKMSGALCVQNDIDRGARSQMSIAESLESSAFTRDSSLLVRDPASLVPEPPPLHVVVARLRLRSTANPGCVASVVSVMSGAGVWVGRLVCEKDVVLSLAAGLFDIVSEYGEVVSIELKTGDDKVVTLDSSALGVRCSVCDENGQPIPGARILCSSPNGRLDLLTPRGVSDAWGQITVGLLRGSGLVVQCEGYLRSRLYRVDGEAVAVALSRAQFGGKIRFVGVGGVGVPGARVQLFDTPYAGSGDLLLPIFGVTDGRGELAVGCGLEVSVVRFYVQADGYAIKSGTVELLGPEHVCEVVLSRPGSVQVTYAGVEDGVIGYIHYAMNGKYDSLSRGPRWARMRYPSRGLARALEFQSVEPGLVKVVLFNGRGRRVAEGDVLVRANEVVQLTL